MNQAHTAGRPTIFLYTEEQRGKQLVESRVIGMLSDISGSDKLIVIKDSHSQLQFVYRIDHASSNLDAVLIIDFPESKFDGTNSILIKGMPYRLRKPQEAMRLLRGKTEWIQDKGSMLSVLLGKAADKNSGFIAQGAITRPRITEVPPGVPIEYLNPPEGAGSGSPQ